jgi:hypothetical protein
MGLQIVGVTKDEALRKTKVLYQLEHSNSKTILDLEVGLTVDQTGKMVASLNVEAPECDTAPEAFERLAEWLTRAAEVLRTSKHGKMIPFSF